MPIQSVVGENLQTNTTNVTNDAADAAQAIQAQALKVKRLITAIESLNSKFVDAGIEPAENEDQANWLGALYSKIPGLGKSAAEQTFDATKEFVASLVKGARKKFPLYEPLLELEQELASTQFAEYLSDDEDDDEELSRALTTDDLIQLGKKALTMVVEARIAAIATGEKDKSIRSKPPANQAQQNTDELRRFFADPSISAAVKFTHEFKNERGLEFAPSTTVEIPNERMLHAVPNQDRAAYTAISSLLFAGMFLGLPRNIVTAILIDIFHTHKEHIRNNKLTNSELVLSDEEFVAFLTGYLEAYSVTTIKSFTNKYLKRKEVAQGQELDETDVRRFSPAMRFLARCMNIAATSKLRGEVSPQDVEQFLSTKYNLTVDMYSNVVAHISESAGTRIVGPEISNKIAATRLQWLKIRKNDLLAPQELSAAMQQMQDQVISIIEEDENQLHGCAAADSDRIESDSTRTLQRFVYPSAPIFNLKDVRFPRTEDLSTFLHKIAETEPENFDQLVLGGLQALVDDQELAELTLTLNNEEDKALYDYQNAKYNFAHAPGLTDKQRVDAAKRLIDAYKNAVSLLQQPVNKLKYATVVTQLQQQMQSLMPTLLHLARLTAQEEQMGATRSEIDPKSGPAIIPLYDQLINTVPQEWLSKTPEDPQVATLVQAKPKLAHKLSIFDTCKTEEKQNIDSAFCIKKDASGEYRVYTFKPERKASSLSRPISSYNVLVGTLVPFTPTPVTDATPGAVTAEQQVELAKIAFNGSENNAYYKAMRVLMDLAVAKIKHEGVDAKDLQLNIPDLATKQQACDFFMAYYHSVMQNMNMQALADALANPAQNHQDDLLLCPELTKTGEADAVMFIKINGSEQAKQAFKEFFNDKNTFNTWTIRRNKAINPELEVLRVAKQAFAIHMGFGVKRRNRTGPNQEFLPVPEKQPKSTIRAIFRL